MNTCTFLSAALAAKPIKITCGREVDAVGPARPGVSADARILDL